MDMVFIIRTTADMLFQVRRKEGGGMVAAML